MANREWDVPPWFTDEQRRNLWLYQNVSENGVTLSTLVGIVEKLSDRVDDWENRSSTTDTKIDKLIVVLTPITSAHDKQISSVVAGAPQNPLQWMIAYPGRTAVGIITATVLGGLAWKAFIWLVHLAEGYGK